MFRPALIGLLLIFPGLPGKAAPPSFTETERDWWAIQALAETSEATLPSAGGEWARNPIDRFIAEKHQGARAPGEPPCQPAPEADRLKLLRRATFDLHGLPPSPSRIRSFLNDKRPDAFEGLIDELLASPRYGEHWAQHWLDVVRYAESDGYRADFFRPAAYRYRDWVIKALNDDIPYDRFVREQLAGDELAARRGKDPASQFATGFLRHGVYEYNQRDARTHWQLILDEVTRTTGEAFLGIGIGCAQCHDHKFDPILQSDYYAFQAYFSSMAWPADAVLASRRQQEAHAAAHADYEEATAHLQFEIDALTTEARHKKARDQVKQFPPDIQAMYDTPEAERSSFEKQMAALVQRQVDFQLERFNGEAELKKQKEKGNYERIKELNRQLKDFDSMKPTPLPTALIATDIAGDAVPTLMKPGVPSSKRAPGLLAILGEPAPDITPGTHSTGRRSALANWITRPDNPLATRVIANRLWQHHFGLGLVATPNDFGTLGQAPSHPELLDWLALELVSGGWKLKRMHRLIMTSATYRQSTAGHAASEPEASDSALCLHHPARRLSAEQIRDAMLAVSGELQTTLGGPSVPGDKPRRSVYVARKRNTPDKVLAAFDAPSGFESTPTRQPTATPTQSLLLSNHPWLLQRAQAFAKRLLNQHGELPAAIEAAYLSAYGRPPGTNEQAAALGFVREHMAALKKEAPPPAEPPGVFVPTATAFPGLDRFGLGRHALQLGPKNPRGAVHIQSGWEDDDFTIQAVVRLDSIHDNAKVNTLVSRWNGQHSASAGWTFGITSKGSAYQPRNLIMQLVGENKNGNVGYEVVDSNVVVPLGVPLYLAAVVRTEPGGGTVTFYAKDLSDPKHPMMVNVVNHGLVGRLQDPEVKCLLGTRDEATGHPFDGLLGRILVSSTLLPIEDLLPFKQDAKAMEVLDWTFDAKRAKPPAEGAAWFRHEKPPSPGSSGSSTPKHPAHRLEALTDLCHALLISNEFLYLD